jgi:hypothetical protein
MKPLRSFLAKFPQVPSNALLLSRRMVKQDGLITIAWKTLPLDVLEMRPDETQ